MRVNLSSDRTKKKKQYFQTIPITLFTYIATCEAHTVQPRILVSCDGVLPEIL